MSYLPTQAAIAIEPSGPKSWPHDGTVPDEKLTAQIDRVVFSRIDTPHDNVLNYNRNEKQPLEEGF